MTSVTPNKEWLSEISKYKQYVQQFSDILESPEENDQQRLDQIVSAWKETVRTTHFCGFNDINRFYERYSEYNKVRKAKCKICTVCGSRKRRYKKNLKDCLQYLPLLEVHEDEVRDYEALMHNIKDRIGRLAQLVFHIEKVGKKHFHFLNLDEEKYYSECNDPKKVANFSLVHNGKVKKLPACDKCAEKLKKRFIWAETHPDDMLNLELGPPLPEFSFKIRDFGRIPEEMPKLNPIGRSAISPFTPFTRITQLRNSTGVEGAAQSATTGTSLSRETYEVCGKEFFIPLTDEEFAKSYQTVLPRDDIASLHRIYYMGNNKN